jgi:hypothetical protein
MLRSVFLFTALLAVAAVHASTKVTILTATSVNRTILNVSFAPTAPPGTTTVLNDSTDISQLMRPESIALGINPGTGFIDAFLGDNGNGQIRLYAGAFSCTTPIPNACSKGTPLQLPPGLTNPNGVTLDIDSNLWAVNDAPGTSPAPAVWKFVRNSDSVGSFQTPTQPIDTTVAAGGTLGKQQVLVELMVVRTPLGTAPYMVTPPAPSGSYTGGTLTAVWPNYTGANYNVTLSTGQTITKCKFTNGLANFTCPSTSITGTPNTTISVALANGGDVVAVSQNPDELLIYPGDGNGHSPLGPTKPIVLIPPCPKPPHGTPPPCLPASTPGGAAVFGDGSLIVTAFDGRIFRFATASGSFAQPVTVTGAPCCLYKVNTTFVDGGPVGYVAQSGPGNHGGILELTPDGSGGIQVSSMVVTNVPAPQAIVATTTQQAPFSSCDPGPCDLGGNHGNEFNVDHKADPPAPSTPPELVLSLCLVSKDPRPICPGQTLLVNSVCPGFDTTPGHNMVIPANACTIPGTGFALYKAETPITNPSQFNFTLVGTKQNPDALFKNKTQPVCGANLPPGVSAGATFWSPNGEETPIVAAVVPGDTINNPVHGLAPTLVDVTAGCSGDPAPKGSTPGTSIFGSGLVFAVDNLGNKKVNLEAFYNQNYSNLEQTIDQLKPSATNHNSPVNVSTFVANLLKNGSTGCVDVSSALFNKAVAVNNVPGDNSEVLTPQQVADFTDALDYLGPADPTGTTACDAIVTAHENSANFNETLSTTPPITNPPGQIEWQLAEISNGILMRILNRQPPAKWEPPVNLNVSPQSAVNSIPYIFGTLCYPQQCPQLPPQVTPEVMTATLSWALVNDPNLNSCSWSGNGTTAPGFNVSPPSVSGTGSPPMVTGSAAVGPFTPPPPGPGSTAAIYTYELTCNVPATTVPTGVPTFSAFTYLTVWPQIGVQATPSGAVAPLNPVTITWTPPAGATGCNLITSGNNQAGFTGTTTVNGPTDGTTQYPASYIPNGADVGHGVTFTAYCAAGASAGIASTVGVSVSPTAVVASNPAGNSATVAWLPSAGSTSCTLSSNGGGSLSGTTGVNGPTDGTTTYLAGYTSTETDATTNGGVVTFTATCTGFSGSAQLTVSP